MKSNEIFNGIISRINNNPMNPKKLYFTFSETVELDKSVRFTIEFGVSKSNSITIIEYMKDGGDRNVSVERIYSNAIDKIFETIYNRIDENSFWDFQIQNNGQK